MSADPIRLSKAVAALASCSRSEAERYIAEGWVRVDGQVVTQPQVRVSTQRIEVDPQARAQPALPATFLVHKPAGLDAAGTLRLLQAGNRWSGDASGIVPARSHGAGLAELLALPAPASGLAVFSQDARIVRKLQDEAAFVEQELVVDVQGTIAPGGLQRLCGGLVYQGQPLPPARVSWQSEHRLRFAVKDIRPDVLPWMCAQVGLQATGVRRIRIGRVPMAGLPAGQWRYLPPGERF